MFLLKYNGKEYLGVLGSGLSGFTDLWFSCTLADGSQVGPNELVPHNMAQILDYRPLTGASINWSRASELFESLTIN